MLWKLSLEMQNPDRVRLLAFKVLGKLNLKTLRKELYKIVKNEAKRANFYTKHQMLQEHHLTLDLQLLVDTLCTGYQSALEFIIELLSIAGEIEDPKLIYRSLISSNIKKKAEALETL